MDYSFSMQSCKSPCTERGPTAVVRRPVLMISASGSNPLQRCSEGTLILRVIRLMNDPGLEALADPTLIMLREPHLGGAGGHLADSGMGLRSCSCSPTGSSHHSFSAGFRAPWKRGLRHGSWCLHSREAVMCGTSSPSTPC